MPLILAFASFTVLVPFNTSGSNPAWAGRLELLSSKTPGPVFVAVGTGHLFGPGNLLECLQNK